MKTTIKSANGTSFHGHVFVETQAKLERVLGAPHFTAPYFEKVQAEWSFETDEGEVFTIYDWKEYAGYPANQPIEWHIGGHTAKTTARALKEVRTVLDEDMPHEFSEGE
jgi:hypothetical protein